MQHQMAGRILNFSISPFWGQEGHEALLPADDVQAEHVRLAPGGLVTFMRCHEPTPGRGLAAADLMGLLAESEPSRPFHTVATILGWVSTHNRSVGQLECGSRGTVHAYRKRTP